MISERRVPCAEYFSDLTEHIESEAIPLLEQLLDVSIEPPSEDAPSLADDSYTAEDYQSAWDKVFPEGISVKKLKAVKEAEFEEGSSEAAIKQAAEAVTLVTAVFSMIKLIASRAKTNPNAFRYLVSHYSNPEVFEETLEIIKNQILPILKEQVTAVLTPPPLPSYPDKPSYADFVEGISGNFTPFQLETLRVLAAASDSPTPTRLIMEDICREIPGDINREQMKAAIGWLRANLEKFGLELDIGRIGVLNSRENFEKMANYRLKYLDQEVATGERRVLPHQDLLKRKGEIMVTRRFLQLSCAQALLAQKGSRAARDGRPAILLGKFLGSPEALLTDLQEEIACCYPNDADPKILSDALSYTRRQLARLFPIEFTRYKEGDEVGYRMESSEDLTELFKENILDWLTEVLRSLIKEHGPDVKFILPDSFTIMGEVIELPSAEVIRGRIEQKAEERRAQEQKAQEQKDQKQKDQRRRAKERRAQRRREAAEAARSRELKPQPASRRPAPKPAPAAKLSRGSILRPDFQGAYELSGAGKFKRSFLDPNQRRYPDLIGARLKVLSGPSDHPKYERHAEKYGLDRYQKRVLVVRQDSPHKIYLIYDAIDDLRVVARRESKSASVSVKTKPTSQTMFDEDGNYIGANDLLRRLGGKI